jgi:hypothetical protein
LGVGGLPMPIVLWSWRFIGLPSSFSSNYNRFLLFVSAHLHIMVCMMTICTIHTWLCNYLVSRSYNPYS